MAYSRCGLYTQVVFGAFFILTSVVMLFIFPSLYSNVLNTKLILTNESDSFDLWKETPIPMYFELFLYNFTNSEAVMANPTGVKPHFEEKGPYTFRETHYKVVHSWNSNGTVTFNQKRVWNFEPTLSNGSLSDRITNINVIASTIINFMKDKPSFLKILVEAALKDYSESAITTQEAGDLLFYGYEDPLLQAVSKLNFSFLQIPFDKFGWFYNRNESVGYDGVFNMETGSVDIMDLGIMRTWNYQHQTKFFSGDCGVVYGSTGELFPPGFKNDNITIFATDTCSPITLRRDGDITIRGIQGNLYVADDWNFDNGHLYPEQACFCPKKGDCPRWGSRDVSTCKFGAPAYVSYPHFYLADPYYLSKVDGLVPDREKDEFKMGLEIITGIPLLVKAQLQINILLQHDKYITVFNKLPDLTYIPMLWFRQEVKLTEEYARKAKLALQIPSIADGLLYSFLTLGFILLGTALFVFIKYPGNNSERQSLVTAGQ